MKKKGLVVIHDPHNLYQFIWYYCNKGKNKEWDALCLPNGYKGEYMHPYCETAGIFSTVFHYDTDFSTMKTAEKLKHLLSMTGHLLIGRRKAYCRKLLNQYVALDDYDELVVVASVGVVTGACVALGQEKEVVILESGVCDYYVRPKWLPLGKIKSAYNWQGFILSKMGYCSPGWFYFKPDQFCVKYSSRPDKMIYRNYRELRQLYTEDGTDMPLFDSIIKRLYPSLSGLDLNKIDAVLLTRPINDYVEDAGKYAARCEAYVNEHFKNVLVKKHPREEYRYQFADSVKWTEVDNSIPAEVMLPYLKNKAIMVVGNSALSLYMKAFGLQYFVVCFKGMYEESMAGGSNFRPLTVKETCEFCDEFSEGCYEILEL